MPAGAAPPHDTIAAIATPPGRGGIGILRLSGPAALPCVLTLLPPLTRPLQPRQARFTHILDPLTGSVLDQGLLTWFPAPGSYTGEETVELAAHGSPVLLDLLLRHTLAAGARLAEPGEFTERAFLHGRLGLTEAEAVRDLIEAQTLFGARVAAQQLGGALARRVRPLKEQLLALITLLEAGIDFAEDDTPVLPRAELARSLAGLAGELSALERTWEHGRHLYSSFALALVGEPNVGKSSLFNRLLDRDRAIVTAEAGTTRDLLSERLSIEGLPVELIDTAGLRETPGLAEAERLGIERSRATLADADLVLLVLDAAVDAPARLLELLAASEGRPRLVVLNKADLLPPDRIAEQLDRLPGAFPAVAGRVLCTSATTGAGLPELRAALAEALGAPALAEQGGAMLTNLRQHTAVVEAHSAVERALAAPEALPDEMMLLDLYACLEALDSLTGQTTPDAILARIFSSFCIGK